jgi:hypothetical protein
VPNSKPIFFLKPAAKYYEYQWKQIKNISSTKKQNDSTDQSNNLLYEGFVWNIVSMWWRKQEDQSKLWFVLQVIPIREKIQPCNPV